MDRRSSGVGDIDVLLGGLIAGDNMAWVSGDAELLDHIERAFIEEGARQGEPCLYASAAAPKAEVVAKVGHHCAVLDARPGGRLADPVALEQTLVKAATAAPGRMVLDGLDDFARRWGAQEGAWLLLQGVPPPVRPGVNGVLARLSLRAGVQVSRWRPQRHPVRDRNQP